MAYKYLPSGAATVTQSSSKKGHKSILWWKIEQTQSIRKKSKKNVEQITHIKKSGFAITRNPELKSGYEMMPGVRGVM